MSLFEGFCPNCGRLNELHPIGPCRPIPVAVEYGWNQKFIIVTATDEQQEDFDAFSDYYGE